MKKAFNKKKFIIILIIILVLVSAVFFLKKPKKDLTNQVKIDKLSKGNIQTIVEVNGNVEAEDSAEITSPYNFEVINISVKEGDKVKKGQVLAQLNPKDIKDEIEILRQDIQRDQTALQESYDNIKNIYTSLDSLKLSEKNAKLSLDQAQDMEDKQKALYEAGAASKQEYENAKNAKDQAKIAYEQAQESLKKGQHDIDTAIDNATPKDSVKQAINIKKTTLAQKEKKLQDLSITSPIDGTVTRVYAKIGRNAMDTEDHKPMFIIENVSKKYVVVKVAEYDIPNIKLGQTATIKSDSLKDQEAAGIVNRISPTAETKGTSDTKVIPVRILLTKNSDKMISGVSATAKIKIAEATNVFKLPIEDVVSENGKDFIYTVQDGKAKKIDVKKGLESDFDVEISSKDIKEGMQVIKNPDETIKEGIQVSVENDDANIEKTKENK